MLNISKGYMDDIYNSTTSEVIIINYASRSTTHIFQFIEQIYLSHHKYSLHSQYIILTYRPTILHMHMPKHNCNVYYKHCQIYTINKYAHQTGHTCYKYYILCIYLPQVVLASVM